MRCLLLFVTPSFIWVGPAFFFQGQPVLSLPARQLTGHFPVRPGQLTSQWVVLLAGHAFSQAALIEAALGLTKSGLGNSSTRQPK